MRAAKNRPRERGGGRKRGGAAFHGEAGPHFACGGMGEARYLPGAGRGALDRKHLPGAQAQGRAGARAGDVSEVQGRAAGSKKPAP